MGRYEYRERHERTCNYCTMNVLGDEYHLFYECSNNHIANIRRRYIPQAIRGNPSMYNFVKLLSNLSDIKLCIKISKFLEESGTL